jgi:hypothetical protein
MVQAFDRACVDRTESAGFAISPFGSVHMFIRRFAVSLTMLGLAACSSSTEPKQQSVSLDDAPNIGPTVTIAGQSTIGNAGFGALGGALAGNPFALAAAGGSGTPAPPVCAPITAQGLISCTAAVNGLNFAYTYGWQDTLGLRSETTVTGTLPAEGAMPSRRINRKATAWTQTRLGDTSFTVSIRSRSNETGTLELLGAPNTISVDTGSADIRFYLRPQDTAIPRFVGTSRRVVWTRTNGGPATFWRETTTYDSSTVIRSVIETPSGTRRCTFDLASKTFTTTCS